MFCYDVTVLSLRTLKTDFNSKTLEYGKRFSAIVMIKQTYLYIYAQSRYLVLVIEPVQSTIELCISNMRILHSIKVNECYKIITILNKKRRLTLF